MENGKPSPSLKTRWPEEHTLKFIKLFAEQECLWNKYCDGYRDKDMKRKAEAEIAAQMGIDGFGPAEAILKIRSLKCCYRQEVMKIEKAKKSGGEYIPRVSWFNTMDSILREKLDAIMTAKAVEMGELNGENGDEDECLDETEETMETDSDGEIALQIRRMECLTSAINEVKKAQETLSTRMDAVSEAQAFGLLVTATLSQLSPKDSVMAQHEIHNVLHKYRLSSTSPQNHTPDHTYHSSKT